MQILSLQLDVPCQIMIPYNFLIASITPKRKYLPAVGYVCSPMKQSECAEMQMGTLYLRGKTFVGSTYNAVCFACRRFLTISQCHKLKLLTTSPAFPTLMFFSFIYSFSCVYPTSHCGSHSERRILGLYCTTFTVPPLLWELSLQQKVWRIGKETCSHSVQL